MSQHKDKNGTWYVKYQNKTYRGFRTKTEAKHHEAMLRLDDPKKKPEEIHFHDLVKDYMGHVKKRMTYSSYYKISNFVDNIIIANTENTLLRKITKLECRDFYNKLYEMPYSTSYKNDILSRYKGIFKHAEIYFNLSDNPTRQLLPFKKTFDEKMKKKEKEKKVWTYEEFNKFIVHVNNPTYKMFFILLYHTGLRLGEAQALQWTDFNDGMISITKAVSKTSQNGSYELKEPKNTSSIREVGLGKNVTALLEEFKQRESSIAGFQESWYIFGRIDPLSRTSITRIKDDATKKAGVNRINLHEFRHSHASNLLSENVNIVSVSRRLGHSSVEMTLGVYAHVIKKAEDELLSKIDESSQNLLNKEKSPFSKA